MGSHGSERSNLHRLPRLYAACFGQPRSRHPDARGSLSRRPWRDPRVRRRQRTTDRPRLLGCGEGTADAVGRAPAPRRQGARSHPVAAALGLARSEEHTSELQSLMRTSYAVFCLKKTTNNITLINLKI